MPSGRYPYPRPCTASQCCFCHRDASRRQRTRGYLWIASSSRHVGTPLKDVCSPPALSDTASLCGRTGRLRRTIRNPLRFDQFLLTNTAVYHLNATVGNSRLAFERWSVLLSDGTYPRSKGRGIARVPPIKMELSRDINLKNRIHLDFLPDRFPLPPFFARTNR